jgi:hypothetical protein
MTGQAVGSSLNSGLGKVSDVGHYVRWKAISSGIFNLLLGGAFLGFGAFFLYLTQAEPALSSLWFVAVLPMLFGWLIFSMTAVPALRAGCQSGCYFRAGPGGLSLRIPVVKTLEAVLLVLGVKVVEYDLRWEQVKSYEVFVYSTSFGSSYSILIRLNDGTNIWVPEQYFAETAGAMVANITRARNP